MSPLLGLSPGSVMTTVCSTQADAPPPPPPPPPPPADHSELQLTLAPPSPPRHSCRGPEHSRQRRAEAREAERSAAVSTSWWWRWWCCFLAILRSNLGRKWYRQMFYEAFSRKKSKIRNYGESWEIGASRRNFVGNQARRWVNLSFLVRETPEKVRHNINRLLAFCKLPAT